MAWVETYRGMVNAWECDTLAHFTISAYFDRLGDAIMGLLGQAGLGMPYLRRERRSLATVEVHSRYLRELRAGDLIHVESGILGADARGARSGHRLYHSVSGAVAATFQIRQRFMDLDARCGVELTPDLRARLEPLSVRWPGPEREPRAAVAVHREGGAAGSGFLDTGYDSAKAWEIDVLEHMSLPYYIQRASAATINALARFGLSPDAMRETGVGFAAFELEGRFLREVRAGDQLRARSALTHVGNSSVRVVTRLYHEDGGELAGAFSQYGVQLDLETRRPRPFGPALRERARSLLLPADHTTTTG